MVLFTFSAYNLQILSKKSIWHFDVTWLISQQFIYSQRLKANIAFLAFSCNSIPCNSWAIFYEVNLIANRKLTRKIEKKFRLFLVVGDTEVE